MLSRSNFRREKFLSCGILALFLWSCLHLSMVLFEMRFQSREALGEESIISTEGGEYEVNLSERRDVEDGDHNIYTNLEHSNNFSSIRPISDTLFSKELQIATSDWLVKYMRKVNCLKFAHSGVLYMYHARKVLPFISNVLRIDI